ncbi:protein GVQW3-like [Rhipicephalus sanguineus]|uniref:protein GVQW3-like n=1 Tax=Rhipicephalus sanguineus TaxID=34632 RepID=UPI0020C5A976|nr:protein GVQW3-like [Rhipicephalus sanguineus]
MTKRLEQRYCIKSCQKLGDSQVETIGKIKTAFGDDAMSRTQIKKWYNRFKDGRTSVESEPRSGRLSTCRNDQVIAEVNGVVMRDRHVTIREIAEEVGISTFSAHSIMTEDLAMKRAAAKFVPKLLTVEQKQLRVEVSQDMLDFTSSDPNFMNTIITGDESWVYGYDPETKCQSSQWKHSTLPKPKKARQVRINVKVMLSAFFDSRGVAHHEYAPQGQTITKECYRDVLRRIRDAVRRKRPQLWSTGNWPPCDFWLFPKLERTFKGERFQIREDIMAATTAELNSIPKEAFSECFQQWEHRWEKCVESQGDYFEGD